MLRAVRQRPGRFIPVYRLGEDGDLHFNEGADMLLIWLLRARSYKIKAEA